VALTAGECPSNPETYGNCAASTPVGDPCEADGELSTNIYLDNCDDYDFYKVAECHAPIDTTGLLVDDGSLGFLCCCTEGGQPPLPPKPPPPSPPPSPPASPALSPCEMLQECTDACAEDEVKCKSGCAKEKKCKKTCKKDKNKCKNSCESKFKCNTSCEDNTTPGFGSRWCELNAPNPSFCKNEALMNRCKKTCGLCGCADETCVAAAMVWPASAPTQVAQAAHTARRAGDVYIEGKGGSPPNACRGRTWAPAHPRDPQFAVGIAPWVNKK